MNGKENPRENAESCSPSFVSSEDEDGSYDSDFGESETDQSKEIDTSSSMSPPKRPARATTTTTTATTSHPIRTKPKKPRTIIHIGYTKYDVIKEVSKYEFGFKCTRYDEEDWDLCWLDTGITSDKLARMKPYQKVNHFPGMHAIARKNNLGRNLMRMGKLFPKEYKFFPPTWLLPSEWADFKNQFNKKKAKTFIVKPEANCQGRGIFLTRNFEAISQTEHCVVQRYLHKPYLIDGLKFDLRVYVLCYGCDPTRIYMYKQGLARFATAKYIPPLNSNLGNLFMHLTNYAINKDSDDFIFNEDADKADYGHKRSLESIWALIEEQGGDVTKIKREIERILVKTILAVQPSLTHLYRSCMTETFNHSCCFELLGFDIFLDHRLKPWLIEVNHSPSFATDTPFDEKVKYELITDTFKLLDLDPNNKAKYRKQKQADMQRRVYSKKMPKYTPEQKLSTLTKTLRKREIFERENLGDYKVIYPDNNEDYNKFAEGAKEVWEDFTGVWRKRKLEEENKSRLSKPQVPTIIQSTLLPNSNPQNNPSSKRIPTGLQEAAKTYNAKQPQAYSNNSNNKRTAQTQRMGSLMGGNGGSPQAWNKGSNPQQPLRAFSTLRGEEGEGMQNANSEGCYISPNKQQFIGIGMGGESPGVGLFYSGNSPMRVKQGKSAYLEGGSAWEGGEGYGGSGGHGGHGGHGNHTGNHHEHQGHQGHPGHQGHSHHGHHTPTQPTTSPRRGGAFPKTEFTPSPNPEKVLQLGGIAQTGSPIKRLSQSVEEDTYTRGSSTIQPPPKDDEIKGSSIRKSASRGRGLNYNQIPSEGTGSGSRTNFTSSNSGGGYIYYMDEPGGVGALGGIGGQVVQAHKHKQRLYQESAGVYLGQQPHTSNISQWPLPHPLNTFHSGTTNPITLVNPPQNASTEGIHNNNAQGHYSQKLGERITQMPIHSKSNYMGALEMLQSTHITHNVANKIPPNPSTKVPITDIYEGDKKNNYPRFKRGKTNPNVGQQVYQRYQKPYSQHNSSKERSFHSMSRGPNTLIIQDIKDHPDDLGETDVGSRNHMDKKPSQIKVQQPPMQANVTMSNNLYQVNSGQFVVPKVLEFCPKIGLLPTFKDQQRGKLKSGSANRNYYFV